jgi:hypothetical protein
MEFFYKNNTLSLESDKKTITFLSSSVEVDGLVLDMSGEYEKGGFLAYAHEQNGVRIYQLRIEGYRVWYIPTLMIELSSEELNFLGDLDILITPTSHASAALIEKMEPRMLLTLGNLAHEYAASLGNIEGTIQKYKLKESDLSVEKMGLVVMGE